MRKLFMFLLSVTCLLSCKKKNDPPPNNNEVKARVVLASGAVVNINATGVKALMGCSFYGGGSYVDGTGETNAAVYMTIYDGSFGCVTGAGTYNFLCEYRVNTADPNTPIYGNTRSGSITYTSANEHYIEGYFNAVCGCNSVGCGVDSVIITGTFKGDHFN